MKKSFVALLVLSTSGAAFADAPAEQKVMSWEGPYVGLHAGHAWGDVEAYTTATGAAPISGNLNGLLGGAYAGYNVELSNIVLGVEADLTISGVDGNPNYSAYASPDGYNYNQEYGGSLRVRAGLPIDNLLIYATAGVALGNFSSDYYSIPTPLRNESKDATHFGLVAGAGAEYAITDTISTRIEYLYTKYSEESYGYSNAAVLPANSPVTFEPETHVIRAGLTWRF